MSIALERIEVGTGFRRVIERDSVFESPSVVTKRKVEDECTSTSGMTSSSLIRKNSDKDDDGDVSGRSSDGGDCKENEVQSLYENPLDMMDSLEEVLRKSTKGRSLINLCDETQIWVSERKKKGEERERKNKKEKEEG
ncbi:hypothetical protein SLA2020_005900 [Shorea laevis]